MVLIGEVPLNSLAQSEAQLHRAIHWEFPANLSGLGPLRTRHHRALKLQPAGPRRIPGLSSRHVSGRPRLFPAAAVPVKLGSAMASSCRTIAPAAGTAGISGLS